MKQHSLSTRSRTVAIATVLCWGGTMGCYSYVPSQASYLEPGREMAVEINDLGRLNINALIGGDVSQIAGILQQQTGTDFTIKVSELTYLNGKSAIWSGEPVTVRQDYVRTVFEKKVSPGKTAAAVLASAGVIGGAVIAHTLVAGGNGNGSEGKPVTPPGTGDRRHQ
ncbi:MAG TPA: hypothetical protein VGG76_12910 [Gemmatimonadaceae bacterium]